MDMISYGAASKVAKGEKSIEDILGQGVVGSFPHTRARLDSLETGLGKVVEKANRAIIDDTINIMKANAKLNLVAQSMRYKHQNMIFEDFLDSSGVDTFKSKHVNISNGAVQYKPPSGTWFYKYEGDSLPSSVGWVADPKGYGSPTTDVQADGSIRFESSFSAYRGWQYTFTSTGNVLKFKWRVKGLITSFKFSNGTNKVYVSISNGNVKAGGSAAPTVGNVSNNDYHTYELLFTDTNGPIYLTIDDVMIETPLTYVTDTTKFVTLGTSDGSSYLDYLYIANVADAEDATTLDLITTQEACTTAPSKALLVVEESGSTIQGSYFISRDDGVHWEKIIPEQIFQFSAMSPLDTKLRLKCSIPNNLTLNSYGLTWS